MSEIAELYDHRFSEVDKIKKEKVWQVLTKYFFQKYIGESDTVLELACGFGEFLTNIKAQRKLAVDINESVEEGLPSEIEFHLGQAQNLDFLQAASIDKVFVSNFFEHLPNKEVLTAILKEVLRILKPGGQLLIMQPNFKYCSESYWDFYDHHLPLSHLSMSEGLALAGYELKEVYPKFVPFSTKSKIPSHPLLVRMYLAFPPIWPIMGKQFFIVAEKPKR